MSTHFSDSNKLKVPANPPSTLDRNAGTSHAPGQLVVPGMPALQPYLPMGPGGFNPYYLPYMHPPPYGLQHGHMPNPAPPFPQASAPTNNIHPQAGLLSSQMASTSSSPGRTMAHNVTLPEFCQKYHISDSDQEKLEALEYHPGNCAVEHFDDHEWRVVGKFSKLGWEAFLVAHRKFCRAIKAGTWL